MGETDVHFLWRRKLEGSKAFVAGLNGMIALHGDKWVNRMREFYTGVIAKLEANEPQ